MTSASEDPKPRQSESERIAEWDGKVLNDLMATPQGRYWVERHLDFCCEGRDLYLNDGDALGMAMRDGLARAGRKLRIELEEHCPDRLLQMVRERRGRIGRAQAEVARREAAAQPGEDTTLSPIEVMADEQARTAEEAERAAKAKPKKKD